MPYYIVEYDKDVSPKERASWDDIDRAVYMAEMRRKENGCHYRVVKVESVWTTKTLAEAMEEAQ